MNRYVFQIGYLSGLVAFTATLSFVIVQTGQLLGLIQFPLDEVLIYSTSLAIAIPYMLQILALHYTTTPDKQFWSHAALLSALMYTIFVIANYVVQLATVIPAKISGTLIEVAVLDQTPHSLFWNFDALGYIFMGLSMLAAIPTFKSTGIQKWVRRALWANVLVTPLIGFVYFYPQFSETLLLLGAPWAITAPVAMLLLAIYFKRRKQHINNQNN